MQYVLLIAALFLRTASCQFECNTTQLGADIDGISNEQSGASVSINGDRVAIGAFASGEVRVYEYNNNVWVQLGADIGTGVSTVTLTVSLDGDRVAIGASTQNVRVYEYINSVWVQLGEVEGVQTDASVSLSGDRVVVGRRFGGSNGQTRVYEYNGMAWNQLGADIDGEANGEEFGASVSLDGDRVAIGAPRYGTAFNGRVRVYEYNGTAWIQLGAGIDGETAGAESGTSVSLDGNRVAIGAPRGTNGGGVLSGNVHVYEYNGTAWVQLGANMDGEVGTDFFGTSVSLDGDRVAIGAPVALLSNGGYVRVYEYNGTDWVQIDADIDGETGSDRSGTSVSLDGNLVAIGAPFNDGNGIDSGHVRVYELSCPSKCGNGVLDGDEQCDDGNAASGDGCSDSCQLECALAGTKSVECGASSAPATCCDGLVCNANRQCVTNVCGNGVVETGEQCDDGNTVSDDGCTDCLVDAGYECPQAGQLCQLLCGNAVLDEGEECDDAILSGSGTCIDCICTKPTIDLVQDANVSFFSYIGEVIRYTYSLQSDSIIEILNLTDNRCSPVLCPVFPVQFVECSCLYTVQQNDLQTDIINNATIIVANSAPTCNNVSTAKGSYRVDYTPACGNGAIDAGEQCDDGNTVSGDGCSAQCTVEITDCNGNSLDDALDISEGRSSDNNANGIPDECDGCVNDERFWEVIEGTSGNMGFNYSDTELATLCAGRAAQLAAQATDGAALLAFLTSVFCPQIGTQYRASFLSGPAANTQCGIAQPQIFSFILNTVVGAMDKQDIYAKLGAEAPTNLLDEFNSALVSHPDHVNALTCDAQSISQTLVNLGTALGNYNDGNTIISSCDSKLATCARVTFSDNVNCTGQAQLNLEGTCIALSGTSRYYSAVCQQNAVVLRIYDSSDCKGKSDRYRNEPDLCAETSTTVSTHARVECASCPN